MKRMGQKRPVRQAASGAKYAISTCIFFNMHVSSCFHFKVVWIDGHLTGEYG